MRGVVAAGHPITARAGADVLRAGGNAVDAAVACVLMSWVAESPLTGPGAGGFMLVHTSGGEDHLLDFFVAAPGRGLGKREPAALTPIDIHFSEDAVQRFNVGPSSCGAYGNPLGLTQVLERFGSVGLSQLTAGPAAAAREGVDVVPMQAFLFEILAPIFRSSPECSELYAPGGELLREGDTFRFAELGDLLDRLGAEGPDFLYTGDVARACCDWVLERGGLLTRRGPGRVRGGRARAGRGELPGPAGAHQPAALVRRHPDRGRARHPGAAGAAARARRDRGGDRVDQPGARRGVPRRARPGGLPGALPAQGRARPRGDARCARGWATRRTSPCSTPRAAARASPARTAPARAWSCPARGCTSTTCSASRTSTRSATTATSRARGCRA